MHQVFPFITSFVSYPALAEPYSIPTSPSAVITASSILSFSSELDRTGLSDRVSGWVAFRMLLVSDLSE